jgi:hypothetical protein
MRSSHTLDSIEVTFDDGHLVADAGLILPATLAQHLGLRDLFDTHIDLGASAGRANIGLKAMTIVHSALAGGDSIDDCDVLRAGATAMVHGHGLRAPSTLGTLLHGFSWGHARQLDKVAGVLLGRAWAAGVGRATPRRRLMSTQRSVKHTGSPSRAGRSSLTPRCVAITR